MGDLDGCGVIGLADGSLGIGDCVGIVADGVFVGREDNGLADGLFGVGDCVGEICGDDDGAELISTGDDGQYTS